MGTIGFYLPFLLLPYITYKWSMYLADLCIFYASCPLFLILSQITAEQQEQI